MQSNKGVLKTQPCFQGFSAREGTEKPREQNCPMGKIGLSSICNFSKVVSTILVNSFSLCNYSLIVSNLSGHLDFFFLRIPHHYLLIKCCRLCRPAMPWQRRCFHRFLIISFRYEVNTASRPPFQVIVIAEDYVRQVSWFPNCEIVAIPQVNVRK